MDLRVIYLNNELVPILRDVDFVIYFKFSFDPIEG
jgi:hypothetical protein